MNAWYEEMQAWLTEAWESRQRSASASRTFTRHALAAARVAALVALPWHGRLLGLLLVGPARSGEPYSPEDLELRHVRLDDEVRRVRAPVQIGRHEKAIGKEAALERLDRSPRGEP